MLKALLLQWKKETEGKGMSKDEQIQRMRDLVKSNGELRGNPFFKAVTAL